MRRGSQGFSLEDLPATIPVFPLTGVLLLPRGRLPLNIFEPRYLAMTEDALASADRLIGMIQPTEPEQPGHPPALYATGCAGRISSFSETEDGRYLITLTGICRFDVEQEVATMRGYRRVVPNFARWQADLMPEENARVDRARLLNAVQLYFAVNKISSDWNAIRETPDERLINMLAMVCPFAPSEKQALLQCEDLAARGAALTALLEMGGIAPGDSEGAKH